MADGTNQTNPGPPGVVPYEPPTEEHLAAVRLQDSPKQRPLAATAQEPTPTETEAEVKEAVRVFKVAYTVRLGGSVLALCAGIVNAVAFTALGTFVSHTTGTLAKVGLGLEDEGTADAGDSVLLLVSFVVGSTTTGFLIAKDTIHFGLALYDMCLLTVAGLLVLATATSEHKVSRYFACAACGLQNGMATHWGGAVIRTTHVTGLFTDVGLLIGRLLSILCRKRCGKSFDHFDHALVQDDLSKLSVLFSIAVSFLLGVFLGAHLYNVMKHHAFLVPASITGVAGVAYSFYRVVALHQRLFSDAEMEIVDVPVDMLDDDVPEAGPASAHEIGREHSMDGKPARGNHRIDSLHHGCSKEVVALSRPAALRLESDLEHGIPHHLVMNSPRKSSKTDPKSPQLGPKSPQHAAVGGSKSSQPM